MLNHKTILGLFIFILLGSRAFASDSERPVYHPGPVSHPQKVLTIFDQLNQTEDILDVTIEFDMAPLIENRYVEQDQKANFSYKDAENKTINYEIKVGLRGKYRRRVCEFPPLMIKFGKKDLKAEGLKDHNDLKLVTHCIDDKFVGNDNVIKEYLLYQMYSELTSNSYRVKLLKVTYQDINGHYPKTKRWAFLIEDTDEMAERLGGEECDNCLNVPSDSINSANENLVSLFQFMIGNADWSSTMNRNVKLVTLTGDTKKLVVPYDFDFSGMVNASYAIPSSDYGLTSIKDRVFLGREASQSIFESNIKLLLEKKETLYNIISDCKLISIGTKSEMIEYLEIFYKSISKIDFNKNILPQLRSEGEEEGSSQNALIIYRNSDSGM